MPKPSKPLPPISGKDIVRFWKHINKRGPDECWPWMASRLPRGYGMFGVGKRVPHAHRIAYFLHYGVDPYPLQVCHSCDNPPCCNPAHLFKGTVQDNVNDMMAKERSTRGESHPNSKPTDAQVIEIIKLWESREFSQRQIGEMYGIAQSCSIRLEELVAAIVWLRFQINPRGMEADGPKPHACPPLPQNRSSAFSIKPPFLPPVRGRLRCSTAERQTLPK